VVLIILGVAVAASLYVSRREERELASKGATVKA
jgi:hypothetical protein